MSREAWLGYGAVASALFGAWAVHAQPPAVLYPSGLLTVFCGAVGYLLICGGEAESLARPPAPGDERPWRERLVHLAHLARVEGARGLERAISRSADALENQALRLLADGGEAGTVRLALTARAEQLGELDQTALLAWRTLARGAVNSGVAASLVQLIGACNAPPEAAYQALAAALAPTLYGWLFGAFVCQPMAWRHRLAADAADRLRTWQVDGYAAIAEGIHPRRLADRLDVVEGLRPRVRAA